MTENNNGFPKKIGGVKVHVFTFEDSDITIPYRKLSPNTILEFNRWYERNNTEPPAPVQKVMTPDGEREEINYSHPDYVEAKKKYDMLKNAAMQDLFINRSIVIELNDEQLEEVNQFRSYWKNKYKEDLEGSDKEVFVRHIACSTPEDMKDFIKAISRRSIPTEEAIAEASKSQ